MENENIVLDNVLTYFEPGKGFYDPVMVSYGGFMFCTKGSCTVLINAKQYVINENDLVVAMPYSLMRISQKSDDFESVVIGVSIDFFIKLQIPNRMEYYTLVKNNPSISISKEESEKILSLKKLLIPVEEEGSEPFNREINDSILRIIFYKGLNIYSKKQPNNAQQNTRDETILFTFITDIFNNYKRERNLNYYAQRQQLTASHLSRAVKRASGRNASSWLIDCVINNLKFSLLNSEQTISSIAEEYNFPNNSMFSQYFKKNTKQTPKEFRLTNKRQAL